MKTTEEIKDYYKRRAAIHEAGHATVAAHFGVAANVHLLETGSDDPAREKPWVGYVDSYNVGSSAAVICIAGAVAECLDDDPDTDMWEIVEEWNLKVQSETDLAGVPEDEALQLEVVKEALSILRARKSLFDRIVEELILREFVSGFFLQHLESEC